MSVLGDRLRELRGNTSQSNFAAPLNMKYQQYARYETGENVPSADFIAAVCREHACSADWLLGLSGSSSNTAIARGHHSVAVAGSNTFIGSTERPKCTACKFKKFAEAFKAIQSPF